MAETEPSKHPFSENVKREDGFHHVASVHIPAGEVICKVSGSKRLPHSIMHSVEVGLNEHLAVYPPIKNTQHSCDPNCTFKYCSPWELVALRPIKKGEEITVSYLISEYDMSDPFTCGCGAASCLGVVKGYVHLSLERKKELEPLISPVIRERRGMRKS